MKKSLIALAALATVATAAQAQSSVTIYGIIDPTLISIKTEGQGKVTALSHGGAASSRLGFRGTEDIGAGLKANFVIEGGVEADSGASSSTSTFHRSTFVQLDQSGVGAITLGRQNRLDYAALAKYDTFGGNNLGGATALIVLGNALFQTGSSASTSAADVRVSNAVTLSTASLNGLVLSYQHSFGEQAGADSKLKQTAFGADYKIGNLELAAQSINAKDSNGAKAYDAQQYFARYDFGVAKAVVGHVNHETTAYDRKATFVGANVPVNAKVSLLANYVKFDVAAGQKPDAIGLGAQYALSKRTTAYALYSKVNQDGGSALRVGGSAMDEILTPGAGKDQTGYGVGIRHTF